MAHFEDRPSAGRMGLNWIWFAPLVAWVVFTYGIYSSILAYRNVRTILGFPHPWATLFSFSTYVFAFATLLNIWTPNVLLLFIYSCFAQKTDSNLYKKRYWRAVAAVLGIFAVVMLTSIVIWGSFPFYFDADGNMVIRLIPFIPWPRHPLVQ